MSESNVIEHEHDYVEIHQGNALVTAMTRYYTLSAALEECVQNCIDNGANHIIVTVDYKNSTAMVVGNGEGATRQKFAEALRNVFSSIKGGSLKRKFGRFGIGLFAPGDKCATYKFIAFDPETEKTHQWVFQKDEIQKQSKVKIPRFEVMPISDGFTTMSLMEDLVKDRSRMSCSASELAHDIRTKFSVAIAEEKIRIEIVITDEKGNESTEIISDFSYSGEPLDVVSYGKNPNNQAEFQIYLAPLEGGKRKGEIQAGITDDMYRLPLSSVLSNISQGKIPGEILKGLMSGVFSGCIISTGCTLNESRRNWRKNDALDDFCQYICEWWKAIGSDLYQDIKSENDESRWQNLGEKVMQNLARILSAKNLSQYRDVMNRFNVGTIGEEHSPVNPELHIGQQEVPSIEATKEKKGSATGTSSNPEKEKKHNPLTVTGTRGQRRKIVKDNSLGLQITFSEMSGSSRMYTFDSRTGVLELNIRHPHWESLEESDTALIGYQTMCIFHALASLVSNPEDPDEYYKVSVVPFMDLWVIHEKLSS